MITQSFSSKLQTYIRAGYPILYIVTAEEDRAIELITKAVTGPEMAGRKPYVWSVSRGLCSVDLHPIDTKSGRVLGAPSMRACRFFPRRVAPIRNHTATRDSVR